MKFVKKIKRKIPWLSHLIVNEPVASELSERTMVLKRNDKANMCILCRGTKHLCGKPKCPILLKWRNLANVLSVLDTDNVEGLSPPDIFVGRIGYPNVFAGPLVPPGIREDTSYLGTPELWVGKTIDDIVRMRTVLLRGVSRINARAPSRAGRFYEKIVEMVLSKRPVDTTIYVKKVLGGLLLDDQMQPMGPIVSVRDMTIEVRGTDHAIEKVYSDDDLKAYDAMLELYRRGVLVSKIIRCLSAGLLGKISERRLVPTRWSITAVDSILSMWLRDNLVKQNPVIGEYRVHEFSNLGDKFIVILFPHVWSYELIEAWFPGTLWNPWNDFVGIAGDWETYHGREGYASIGGCYYAARLAVSEFLAREGKQAAVLILRESYPEHILPVGVWHVRESVRAALKQKPVIFNNLRETLDYVFSRLKISSDIWMKTSSLLRFILRQRKLDDYLKHSSTMR